MRTEIISLVIIHTLLKMFPTTPACTFMLFWDNYLQLMLKKDLQPSILQY